MKCKYCKNKISFLKWFFCDSQCEICKKAMIRIREEKYKKEEKLRRKNKLIDGIKKEEEIKKRMLLLKKYFET